MEESEKIDFFVEGVLNNQPDIIALQEVNQTATKKIIPDKELYNFVPIKEGSIKEDNYAFIVWGKLKKQGVCYNWTWLPIKQGYDCFEEGLSFLVKNKISQTDCILLSQTDDFKNWKKRMALGVLIGDEWFYNVHMGWYDDQEEPFEKQWHNLYNGIIPKENVWIMGDFNNDADKKGEGYDLILSSGWNDCFVMAKQKDAGYTVEKEIAGWKGQNKKIRIDYIWSKKSLPIKSSYVIFNGKNEPIVSDHAGVIVEI